MKAHLKDFVCYAVATGFGTGLIPGAPGTYGSILAVLLAWIFFPGLPVWGQVLWIVVAVVVGTYAAHWFSLAQDQEDPPMVVVDEMAGQWIALLCVPMQWTFILTAFLLFRLADIFKPGPVDRLQRLPGGLGIMADDILAGLFALVAVHLLRWFVL